MASHDDTRDQSGCNSRPLLDIIHALPERRYKISEVCAQLGMADHVLRHWEKIYPQLKINRDKAGRRYYTKDNMFLIVKIRNLMHQRKLKPEGVRLVLGEEEHREGQLRTNREIVTLLDELEAEVRAALDLLASD